MWLNTIVPSSIGWLRKSTETGHTQIVSLLSQSLRFPSSLSLDIESDKEIPRGVKGLVDASTSPAVAFRLLMEERRKAISNRQVVPFFPVFFSRATFFFFLKRQAELLKSIGLEISKLINERSAIWFVPAT